MSQDNGKQYPMSHKLLRFSNWSFRLHEQKVRENMATFMEYGMI